MLRFRRLIGTAERMYGEEAYDLALQALEEARGIRADDPLLLYYLGHLYRKMNRLGPAEEALRASLEAAPDRPEARLELGMVYFDQFGHERAAEEFRRLLADRPGDAAARYHLGLALYRLNRWQEAETEFRTLLEADPAYPEGNYQLGRVLLQAGRPRRAIESFRGELRRDPRHAPSHFNLAKAYRLLGDGEQAAVHEEEFRILSEQAIERKRRTRQASTRANQGLIHYDRQEYDRAAAEFRAALEERRDDAEIWAYLGSAYLELQDLDRAEEALGRSRTLAPNQGFTLMQLARIRILRGELDAGERLLREAVQKNPSDPGPHLYLARLYRRQERLRESEEEMRIFRSLEAAGRPVRRP